MEKPVVMVNETSRSGKEILAFSLEYAQAADPQKERAIEVALAAINRS